jgi:hypothetical protein
LKKRETQPDSLFNKKERCFEMNMKKRNF